MSNNVEVRSDTTAGSETKGEAYVSAAAGIVVYRPNPDRLVELARALKRETQSIFVFLNGATDTDTERRLRDLGAELIASDYNLGVAEALNILSLAAILRGHTRLLLMDQDSLWPHEALHKLSAAMDAAVAAGRRPAVIGPAIAIPPEGDYKTPRYFSVDRMAPIGSAAPVRYLITSGSLIDLDALRAVGRFRSDFFIDAIDTEWCFRAWSRGYSCWVERDVEMIHTIGTGTMGRSWLGPRIPRQRPFRLYAYVRNQIYCLRLAHLPFRWKMRIVAHLARLAFIVAFSGERDYTFTKTFLRAVRDGAAGRLGPPPGVEGAIVLSLS